MRRSFQSRPSSHTISWRIKTSLSTPVVTVCTSRMKIWKYLCQVFKGRTKDHQPAWIRWWPFVCMRYLLALFHRTPSIQYSHLQRPEKEKNALPIHHRYPTREATSENPRRIAVVPPKIFSGKNNGPSNIQYLSTPGTSVSQATIPSHFATRVTHPFVRTGRR